MINSDNRFQYIKIVHYYNNKNENLINKHFLRYDYMRKNSDFIIEPYFFLNRQTIQDARKIRLQLQYFIYLQYTVILEMQLHVIWLCSLQECRNDNNFTTENVHVQ